jgi:ComF family protein
MKNKCNIITYAHEILEAIAPIHCCICSVNIQGDSIIHRICDSCYMSFDPAPTSDILLNSLFRKGNKSTSLLHVDSLFEFQHDGAIQIAIHEMKYGLGINMAFQFGRMLALYRPKHDIDAIIPIPLHAARKRERGFNQACEIAKGFAYEHHLDVIDCLHRNHYTMSQTTLNIEERQSNVQAVFSFDKKENIINKRLLLIDDVFTTGATLEHCAEVLLEYGARSVSALTIASVQLKKG